MPTPKEFGLLAKLVHAMFGASHPAVQSYASNLVQRVENEDDLEMTVDQAVDDLTAFENRTEWAEAVGKLLEKQKDEIAFDSYSGEGADRGHKDELKVTLEPLRKIMGI